VPPVAAKAATSTIPIVFAVSVDPVGLGLVASLSRPGGNATGINFFVAELVEKRLRLLHELVPSARRVAVLVNPADAAPADGTLRGGAPAARAMALQIQPFNPGPRGEIPAPFERLVHERPDALFAATEPFFLVRRVQLAPLAARYGLPASFAARD